MIFYKYSMSKSIKKSREKLLWELISKVRSNLDVNNIKKNAVKGLAKIFKPDRCAIIEYDENGHTLPIQESSEYLSSQKEKSMVGINLDEEYDFGQITNLLTDMYIKHKKNVIYIPDSAEYIKKSKLLGSKIEKYCIHSNFTTSIGVSIFESDKIRMFFTLKFKDKTFLSEDDIEFIKICAEQIYIAIKQNQIITKFKHTSENEKMFRKILSTIRKTMDVEKIKKIFVCEVGKYMGATRAFFSKYDPETNTFFTPDQNSEYVSSPDIPSYHELGRDFSSEYKFFSDMAATNKKIFIMPDREELIKKYNLEGTNTCINLRKYNVGTSLLVGANYKNIFFGGYVFECEKPNSFTPEAIDFAVAIASQTSIILYQIEALNKIKISARNEALLRKIITKASTALNIDDMKKMVDDIGKVTKADRCYFVEIDSNNNSTIDFKSEYLSSHDIKSIAGYNFSSEELDKFLEIHLVKKNIGVFDFEKLREENLPQNEPLIKYSSSFGLKTGMGIPFFYRGKLFAILVIEYIKEKVLPSTSDLDFLKLIVKQVGIAFNQIKLYQDAKQTAERERLLRNVVSVMSSTLDRKKLERYITKLIGTTFRLDRCFIIEYFEKNPITMLNEYSEYRASKDVKSLVGYDFSKNNAEIFKNIVEIFDREAFLKELKSNEIPYIEDYLKEYSINSGFQVKLSYGDEFLGILVGHSSDESKIYSEQEKELIRALAKHAGISLYQSKLYFQEKQLAEREKLLRDIITATRKTLDIKHVKKTIVNEVLEIFKADRVSIIEYNNLKNKFMIADESSEALSSKDMKGFKGIDVNHPSYKYFQDIYCSKKEIIYSDVDEFIEKNGLLGTIEETLMKETQSISVLSVPILYKEDFLGILIITYATKHIISQEQVDFIRSLSEQIAIAIYQSRLFEKEKKARQKEKLLNRIVTAVRRSIDLNEMKKNIATYIGKYFEADKVIIHQMKPKTKEFDIIDEFSEYRVSDDILSYIGIDVDKPEFCFFKSIFSQAKEVIIPDFEEYIENIKDIDEDSKENIKNLNIKSNYTFPIKHQNNQIASLFIVYNKKKVNFTKEELDDIRYLVIHIGLALNQAMTYQALQSKIEQELLLRKLIETIRSSLDLNEMKQKIVEELGKALDADRCYLRSFDMESKMFLAPDVEYLSSPDIKSLKNVVPDQEGLRFFFEQVKNQDGIYPVEVTEDFIIEHQAQNEALDRYFKQSEIKSDLAMPVWSKKGELTFIVLHYINKKFEFTEEAKQFLIMISRQISIALEQSDLYNEVKNQSEREKMSRKIVDIIRSSLDIDQILLNIAQELLEQFDVQKIFVGRINFTIKGQFVEVTSRDDIKRFSKAKNGIFDSLIKYWEDYLYTQQTTKIIENIEESDMPYDIKKAYIDVDVKSLVCVPIKSRDKIWGGIFLSSIDDYKKWTKDEISFLEGVISQLDMAIRHAELYLFQKQTAKKESILRNIISEIKLTRDLNQAYGKLLENLAEIFNLNRVLFLESSAIVPEELSTKYEYVIEREDLSINNLVFPQVCMEKFFNLINHLKPLTINDVSVCHPRNTLGFFEKYKIKAMMAVPLVKYSREAKVLGFIVLCSEEKRIWTEEEINLINAISESVVSVIWEISKFIEIEDLRNSFILTLAHDFQVPLIGEKLAIEFLLENYSGENEQNKNLLEEILENNNNIITLLNKSVDIYNYDAGKKVLSFDVYDIYELLNKIVYIMENADKKSVNIDLVKFSKPLFVKIDKQEIMKVLNTVIENAIDHSPMGEIVKIRYYIQNKKIIISIHNKGAAIPKETQEVIFKRYEMALAIERKIGAGTGLFLAKKIIEAHKGNIWFETSNERGTTFFISLPQVKLKHV